MATTYYQANTNTATAVVCENFRELYIESRSMIAEYYKTKKGNEYIVVHGETKPYRHSLRQLYGKFVPNLYLGTYFAGWLFYPYNLDKLQTFLNYGTIDGVEQFPDYTESTHFAKQNPDYYNTQYDSDYKTNQTRKNIKKQVERKYCCTCEREGYKTAVKLDISIENLNWCAKHYTNYRKFTSFLKIKDIVLAEARVISSNEHDRWYSVFEERENCLKSLIR